MLHTFVYVCVSLSLSVCLLVSLLLSNNNMIPHFRGRHRRRLRVLWLEKEITPKILMLCFVLINSVLLNLFMRLDLIDSFRLFCSVINDMAISTFSPVGWLSSNSGHCQ